MYIRSLTRDAGQHFGVGIIPWSPLARGLVTRPLGEQTKRHTSDTTIHQYLGGGTEAIVSR